MNIKTKLAVITIALVSLITPLAVAPAHAATSNMVVFGDSFAANPKIKEDTARMQWTEGCIQAPDNWPRLVSQKTGIPVADYSCNGRTSRTMLHRIDQAIASGALNSTTQIVAISVGGNNYWKPGLEDGVNIFNYNDITNNYISDIEEAARRIRTVAPHVRIIMPGMLSISKPDGLNGVCLVVLHNQVNLSSQTITFPDFYLGLPMPFVQNMEQNLRYNQWESANRIGAEFIDIKEMTKYNNTCANGPHRFVSSYMDDVTADYNMIFHPSRAGSEFIADRVVERI